MSSRRKRVGVDPRIHRTEQSVIKAARELFERHGYQGTTMTQIAKRAGCAERTLFLRFKTKADLFTRVVDATLRHPGLSSQDAPPSPGRADASATLDERLRAFAEGAADALVRTGPLFAVAREAEASEPTIARSFDAARRHTLANSHRMWRSLADAGLIGDDVDIEWVADTTGLLAAADTYLLITTTLGWSRDDLAAWLHRTWTHFATTPS